MDDEKLQRFREQLNIEVPRNKGRNSDSSKRLFPLKDDIQKAREMGFGYKQIAEMLRKAEVEANADSVRRFCKIVLKEKTKPKPRRRTTNAETNQSGSLHKNSNVDTEKAESASKPSGARPGFRVARDDL